MTEFRGGGRKRENPAFRCKDCRKDFTCTSYMSMYISIIGYREWAIVIFMMTTNIKGTFSTKLAHNLVISQRSAWYMASRIREAYQGKDPIQLETVVEVDEAYFGGVEIRKHEDKKLNKGRCAVGKIAVVDMKERKTGRVVEQRVKDTTKETLQGFIQCNVEEGSKVYTDDFKS